MKFMFCGLFVLAIGSGSASLLFSSPVEEYIEKYKFEQNDNQDVKEVRESIFAQWVDHSNLNEGTFQQTVYINDQNYYPGGPVFILVSAGPDTYSYWLENSHIVNIAIQLGAVIYALEPRYFGKSFPTEDLSLANFQNFLQLNQTMGDYANFITFLQQELAAFGSDKFVLVGHGRGGTLATWLHQRYPNLANGIWAISAPIITLFDFGQYYQGMGSTFENLFPATCQQVIIEAFGELEVLIDDGNTERIREIFLISPFSEFDVTNAHDVALFYNYLFEILFTAVEYGIPSTIDAICTNLVPSDEFSNLELLGQFYGSSLYDRVLQYDLLVSILQQDSLDVQYTYDRQSLYVACSGWSQFKTSEFLPNPINYRFNIFMFGDLCHDVFGLSFSDVADANYRTNIENQVSPSIPNAYFTNAEFDPHRIIGVQVDMNPTSPHNFIPGMGKLNEFLRVVFADYNTPALSSARSRATQLITLWTRP